MKVVALDIDGVLTTPSTKWQLFQPSSVKALKRILDTTGAKIVLSSAWRHGFIDWRGKEAKMIERKEALQVMSNMLADFDIPEDTLIDRTPFSLGDHRGKEIGQWLEKHPEVESFVILDDDLDVDPFIKHLVLTDFEKGLTEENADTAISILTKTGK